MSKRLKVLLGFLLFFSCAPLAYYWAVLRMKSSKGPGATAVILIASPESSTKQSTTNRALLVSESVMSNSAKMISTSPYASKLPTDTKASAIFLASRIQMILEPEDPNRLSDPTITVHFQHDDREFAKVALERILDTYRDEFRGIYEEVVVEKMSLLRSAIDRNTKKIEANLAELMNAEERIRAVTKLDPKTVEASVSLLQSRILALSKEQEDWKAKIKILNDAGKDLAKQSAVLIFLGFASPGKTDSTVSTSDVFEALKGIYQSQSSAVGSQLEDVQRQLQSEIKILSVVQPEQQRKQTLQKLIEGRQNLNEDYEKQYTDAELKRIGSQHRVLILQPPAIVP
ncbi:hypothetical protein BH11PLA2_BH11PLA2_06980 [soil metagenome]